MDVGYVRDMFGEGERGKAWRGEECMRERWVLNCVIWRYKTGGRKRAAHNRLAKICTLH